MSNLLMQDLATIEAITWNVYGQRIGEYEQFLSLDFYRDRADKQRENADMFAREGIAYSNFEY